MKENTHCRSHSIHPNGTISNQFITLIHALFSVVWFPTGRIKKSKWTRIAPDKSKCRWLGGRTFVRVCMCVFTCLLRTLPLAVVWNRRKSTGDRTFAVRSRIENFGTRHCVKNIWGRAENRNGQQRQQPPLVLLVLLLFPSGGGDGANEKLEMLVPLLDCPFQLPPLMEHLRPPGSLIRLCWFRLIDWSLVRDENCLNCKNHGEKPRCEFEVHFFLSDLQIMFSTL